MEEKITRILSSIAVSLNRRTDVIKEAIKDDKATLLRALKHIAINILLGYASVMLYEEGVLLLTIGILIVTGALSLWFLFGSGLFVMNILVSLIYLWFTKTQKKILENFLKGEYEDYRSTILVSEDIEKEDIKENFLLRIRVNDKKKQLQIQITSDAT